MSQVTIQGNASGTGVLTIAAPNTSSNYTLTLPAATGTIVTNNTLPAGTVLQVVQTQKTSVFSSSSTSFVDITGMSVSITPTSATSKILVSFSVHASANSAGWYGSQLNLVRGSTSIAIGDASGSNSRVTSDFSCYTGNATLILPVTFQWLDSPATTSATTYKLQLRQLQASTVYINQSTYVSGTAAWNSMTPSTITVMEIAA